jgi:5-(carboxyamino)imidazole ribonucleotide mutase
MVGRGSRVMPTKNEFTILDFGNNIQRHHYWEAPRKWNLKKKEKKEGAAPIKECSECCYLMPARIMDCPECGHVFEKSEKEKEEDVIVELQKLSSNALKSKIQGATFKELEMIQKAKGYKVIIAGAGGSAHLPGMVASLTSLPVIGVPVALKNLDGMDSLLSIVQMPAGIPVATVGVGNAKNAGLLAARILGISDEEVSKKVSGELEKINTEAKEKGANLTTKRSQKTGF